MTIIYIVGYERSGSTLLHNILSENEDVTGVGELRHIDKRLHDLRPCGCGKDIYSCEFWGDLAEELKQKRKTSYTRDRWILLYPILRFYFNFFRKEEIKYFKKIYDYSFRKAGTNIIVDSSKSLTHLFLLKVILKYKIRTLFIVRNPNGILFSLKKRIEKGHEKYSVSSLFYQRLKIDFLNKLITHVVKVLGCYRLVYYEDLVSKLNETTFMINDFVGIKRPVNWNPNGEIFLSGTHSVDGGPTRHVKGLVQLREDNSWKSDNDFNVIKTGYTHKKYYAH